MEEEARLKLQEFQQEQIEKKGKSSLYICDEMDEAALLAVKLSIQAKLQSIEATHAKITDDLAGKV